MTAPLTAAEIASMKAKAVDDINYSTHWEGCADVHKSCAIIELVAECERLRKELDTTREHKGAME